MIHTTKKQFFGLIVLTALLVNCGSLFAIQGTWQQNAEVVTSFLRGTCSKIEFELSLDDSKGAHAKRALISALRTAHNGLMFYNHQQKLPIYNDYGAIWMAFDGAQMLYRFGQMLSSSDPEQEPAQEAVGPEQQAAPVDVPAVAQVLPLKFNVFDPALMQEVQGVAYEAPTQQQAEEQYEFLRGTLFPEIERCAALFLAVTNIYHFNAANADAEKYSRFVALSLLSFTRLCQVYFQTSAESNWNKLLKAALVVHVIHSLYQVLKEDSSFRIWLAESNKPADDKKGGIGGKGADKKDNKKVVGDPNVPGEVKGLAVDVDVKLQRSLEQELGKGVEEKTVLFVKKDGKEHNRGSECAICLQEWHDEKTGVANLVIMPCGHALHQDCLKGLKECHLCRGPIAGSANIRLGKALPMEVKGGKVSDIKDDKKDPVHRRLRANPEIKVNCVICSDDGKPGIKLSCGAEYCTECLTQHVRSKLRANDIDIVCPGCPPKPPQVADIKDDKKVKAPAPQKHIFDLTELRGIDPNLEEELNDAGVRKFLAANGTPCPTPGCPNSFILDGNVKRGVLITCSGCKKEYCRNCRAPHKNGSPCQMDKKDQDKENAKWVRENTKPCPHCNTRVQKNDGCKFMTCLSAACGGKHRGFCWDCGARTYGHENHNRPDGRQCNTPWFT